MCLPHDSNAPPPGEDFVCPNRDCRYYGQAGTHISVRGRYGKNHDRILLWCRSCRRRFAATKGSHYQNSHLTIACQERILQMAWEGKSIRKIASTLGHDKDTVNRVIKNAGLYQAKKLTNYLGFIKLLGVMQKESTNV